MPAGSALNCIITHPLNNIFLLFISQLNVFYVFTGIITKPVVPLHQRVQQGDDMEITINVDDPIPIFNQLVEQIKRAVSNQHLKAGDPLPSIRQLANDLEVNSKTVAKAYRILERDNVIEAKGYRGTFIHREAMENIDVDINALIDHALTTTISNLRQSGATDSEIRIAFTKAMNN